MESNTSRTVLPWINTQQDVSAWSMHTWKAATCSPSLLSWFQLPTKGSHSLPKGSAFILILKRFGLTIPPLQHKTKRERKLLRQILIFFCYSIWGVWLWMVLFTLPAWGWCCWTWSRFTQIRGTAKITGKGWGWQLQVFHAGSSGTPKFNPQGSRWVTRAQNCKQRYSHLKPLDWEWGQI